MGTTSDITSALKEARAENAVLKAEVATLKTLVAQLQEQARLSARRQYGTSSEKAGPGQLPLFNEAEAHAPAKACAPVHEEITYRRRKAAGKREADLSKLEHVRIDYGLDESERTCPACSGPLHDMGTEVRSELTVVPARIYVTDHAAHKYACRHCDRHAEATPILTAKAPEPLIKGSYASASLIAHTITSKYQLALPLYRQEADWRSKGIDISRQSMANWVIAAAEFARPVYELMRADLISRDIICADETTVQVLGEPGRPAASKSYMWLYRSGADAEHPLVLYDYRKSRSVDCPKGFLRGYSGYVCADGHGAYRKLPGVTVSGCMAHARRKFDEALKILPETERAGSSAAIGLGYFSTLFALERDFAGLGFDERYEARLEKSKPVFDEMCGWATSLPVLPKSACGRARHYLLAQRPYLENVYLDGRLEVSNNRAERSIKPFVIGRKNWLFANTPRGAHASATLYSVIETAKENRLKVFEYLTYLFEQLPNTTTSRINELAPHSGKLPPGLYLAD